MVVFFPSIQVICSIQYYKVRNKIILSINNLQEKDQYFMYLWTLLVGMSLVNFSRSKILPHGEV
jgi:hypothetical protein